MFPNHLSTAFNRNRFRIQTRTTRIQTGIRSSFALLNSSLNYNKSFFRTTCYINHRSYIRFIGQRNSSEPKSLIFSTLFFEYKRRRFRREGFISLHRVNTMKYNKLQFVFLTGLLKMMPSIQLRGEKKWDNYEINCHGGDTIRYLLYSYTPYYWYEKRSQL
jgi:hypothetical protein